MSAELVPSEDMGGNLFHTFPLSSGGLLVIFGVPWFIDTSLPAFSHGILPVSVSDSVFKLPPFHKDAVVLD